MITDNTKNKYIQALDDSDIYTFTCAKCMYEKECHEECEICHYYGCILRQVAADLLADSSLEGEAYYEAEDTLVEKMYLSSDTKFKDWLLEVNKFEKGER